MFAPLLVWVALLVCLAGMLLVIAFDTRRVLAGVDRCSWARAGYRRQVPNLLTLLYRAGLTQPWPKRLTGFSIFRFRRKLRRLIQQEQNCPIRLVEWHVGFWAHVQERLPLVEYSLCAELNGLIQRICQAVPESQCGPYRLQCEAIRQRQIHLESVIKRRYGSNWGADAAALFVVLKTLQIVFAEHGFHIHPDFVRLRELEETLEPILPSTEQSK